MKSVLVIDDDPEILQVVSKMLAPSGYNMITAGNEAAALIIIKDSAEIDLAIVDFWMNSKPALKILKTLEDHRPSLPIMMMSGGGGELSMETAHNVSFVSGATQFIQKPFKRDDLLSKINLLLP